MLQIQLLEIIIILGNRQVAFKKNMNPKNNFINSLSNKISNFSVGVKKPVPQTPVQTSPYQVGVSAPRPGVTAPAKAMITSNPSATSANKTVIKAPTTNSTGTALSSAGKQFANTLSANDASNKYNTATGELNTNFSGYTAPDNNKNTTASTQPVPQEDPYIKYLNSLFNPEQTTKALDTLNSANTRLTDIQNRNEKQALDARVNYENTLDTPGGLKIGAEQAASVGNRRASAESAYGAIEEGAAARSAMVAKDTYDQYINAGKTVYEATQAANKAKQDQENSDRIYNLNKTGQESTIENNKASTELANKKFEEDKRQYGLDYALKAKEVAIRQQETNQKGVDAKVAQTAANDTATGTINLVNSLINNPGVNKISGIIQGGLKLGNLGGANAQLARNQYNQIKGLLSLENRSKLKGQGAVSDFEGKMLESASSSLGRNLSDEEFVRQLKQVRGAIATSHGQFAEVLVIDPKTKQSQIISSDSQGIAQAIKDGLRVEYQ